MTLAIGSSFNKPWPATAQVAQDAARRAKTRERVTAVRSSVRPTAELASTYRRKLLDLIDKMSKSVIRDLSRAYGEQDHKIALISGDGLAYDVWEESKHPRDREGKFTRGGGSSGESESEIKRSLGITTISRLVQNNFLTGPIVGGFAYAVLTGDYSDFHDVDIDGSGPHADEISLSQYTITDTNQSGYVRELIDNKTDLKISYLSGHTFKGKLAPIQLVEKGGVEVQSPISLIDNMAVRGRLKDDKRVIRLIDKFGIKFEDHDWQDKRKAALLFAIHDVGEKDEDALIERAKAYLRSAHDASAAAVSDAEFVESEHPRDREGKFTRGGGSESEIKQKPISFPITRVPIHEILKSDVKWPVLRTTTVRVSDVKASQKEISAASTTPTRGPIDAVKLLGEIIVIDGHNRVARAKSNGEETIDAKVLDLDSPENKRFLTPEGADWLVEKRLAAALAHDASAANDLQDVLRWLRRRWERRFRDMADELAEYFATTAARRSDAQLRRILFGGGISVKFKLTDTVREVLRAVINENVALIKSIPEQYLAQVEGSVMRSVVAGRDLQSLTKDLREQHGVTKRRAELIARDQNNKATGAITRARYLDLGIQKAVWLHSHAGREPRPTHVANHQKEYDVAKGWYDPDPRVRDYVMPGQLINCRCTAKPILPGMS